MYAVRVNSATFLQHKHHRNYVGPTLIMRPVCIKHCGTAEGLRSTCLLVKAQMQSTLPMSPCLLIMAFAVNFVPLSIIHMKFKLVIGHIKSAIRTFSLPLCLMMRSIQSAVEVFS